MFAFNYLIIHFERKNDKTKLFQDIIDTLLPISIGTDVTFTLIIYFFSKLYKKNNLLKHTRML